MAKITELPQLQTNEITGAEMVPVARDGQSFSAPIEYLGRKAAENARAAADSLYPGIQRNTVEQKFEERFAAFDLSTQTVTNLTDGAAAIVTKTKVGGGLQLALTTSGRDFAFSTASRLNPRGKTRVVHTSTCTFASTCRTGISIVSGGTRRNFIYANNGALITEAGIFASGLQPLVSGDTVRLEVIFDPDRGTAYGTISINGKAPYSFGIDGVTPGNIELVQRGNSTVVHSLDLDGSGALAAEVAQTHERVFNEQANAEAAIRQFVSAMERKKPTGFTAPIPYNWRFYASTMLTPTHYFSNIDLQPMLDEDDPTVTVYHVDIATGDDTGAGTAASPLKSLNVAQARILSGARAIIKAKGGLYPYQNAFRGSLGGRFVQIVSWDGEQIISSRHDTGLVWTLTSGTTWQAPFTQGISAVNDAGVLTEAGLFTRVGKVASLATCQATLNSYFVSNGIIYVNIGREPDDDLRVYKRHPTDTSDHYNLRWVANGNDLYMEDITFQGGHEPLTVYSAGDGYAARVFGRRVSLEYAGGANGLNFASPGLAVFQESRTAGNLQDGFNYKPSSFGMLRPLCIEIFCAGFWNGYTVEGTNNGTTAHGCIIVRVGGWYHHNQNRNVHDIRQGSNGSLSLNLGVRAGFSREGNNVNFAIGVDGEIAGSIMWMDGCISEGSATDLQVNGDAQAFIHDFTSGGVFSGTPEAYTP